MNTGSRIRQIRQSTGLSMEKFGDLIGIKKSSISLLEKGTNNPSDQTIMLICREFNVSETWLRTGKGEMFNPAPVSEMDTLAGQYGLSPSERELLKRFITLNPTKRKAALDYLREVVEAVNEVPSGANFYRLPQDMTLEELHAEIDRQNADEKGQADASGASGFGSSGTAAG